MSYGVALRNGIPFTLGTIAALCVNATGQAWTPLALWPTGTEPGMWIDPSNLTSQWQDSTGTTQVSTPGTVADSSNPVGLALDLRLGATALTDPGNHLLQATSTARPLLSARVNLLTYTEDFGNAAWLGAFAYEITSDSTTAPDGTLTADKYVKTTAAGFAACYQLNTYTGNSVFSFYAKYAGHRFAAAYFNSPDRFCYFDIVAGTVGSGSAGCTSTIEDAGGGWYRCAVAFYQNGATNISFFTTPTDGVYSFVSDGTSGAYFWGAQLEHGLAVTPYQPILTDGSSYSSTGFPVYQKYDGTDDGMATASFAAGTLSNAMDCLIAVRRDSGAGVLLGISGEPTFTEKYTGACINNSGDITYKNCGTPTVWVDGVQLAGGTATTRAALFAALTVGDWHILEYRNLNLSTWTAVHYGNVFTGLNFDGARGDILLYPSSTPTADRDAARTWLGAKVGLTL